MRRIALSLITLALLPAQAQAMELGWQDDATAMYQPAAFAQRIEAVQPEWFRIMIPDNHWKGEKGAYIAAVQAAKARGQKVFASLLAWQSHPTAEQWKAYASEVYGELGAYVDAWAPMNEPNWPGMTPYLGVNCVKVSDVSEQIAEDTMVVAGGWKQVRRGKGTHRRIVKRKHGHVVQRFKKARTRKAKRRARWIKIQPKTSSTTHIVRTTGERQVCTNEAAGRAYRKVYDAVAPILSQGGAKLVWGDLCPGPYQAFADAFYEAGEPAIRPAVIGIHPYATVGFSDQIEIGLSIAQKHGAKLWASEWGIRTSDGLSQSAWTNRLNVMRDMGVDLTVIYDTKGGSWDTKVPDAVMAQLTGV